jgi:hypothetical protein
LFEAISLARYGASASWIDQATLDRVTGPLSRVPLGDWRWPAYPGRFFVGKGAFVFTCPNGEWQGKQGVSIWVGARTSAPLVYLKEIVDKHWEHVAF